jgi:transcription elongation GreA/GreB family factor
MTTRRDAVGAVDKRALLEALRAQLTAELHRVTQRAVDAADAATHEENRPEGDKDMRATEASYIARGQAERARALEQALAKIAAVNVREFAPGDPIALTALVELDHEGRRSLYFLLPAAGGERLPLAGGREVQTLATTSPLGAAMLGLTEGDDLEVSTPQGPRSYEIARVA